MPVQNIQGLKGLSKEERQAWENEQLVNIGASFNNYNEAEKDRIYRNQQFKSALGSRDDYNELIKYTPAERDRIFANVAFKEQFGNDKNYSELIKNPAQVRDEYYINQDIYNRGEQRFGKDKDNLPEWEVMKRTLSPMEIDALIKNGYTTRAERDKDYIEHLKFNKGEEYDATKFLETQESVFGDATKEVSGGEVAKAFGKALLKGFTAGIKGLFTVGGFAKGIDDYMPGGDTKWRHFGVKLGSAASTAIEGATLLGAGAVEQFVNFTDALHTGSYVDKDGNYVSLGGKPLKAADSFKELKDLPYNYTKRVRDRIYDAMYNDAVAKSSEEYAAKAEQLGAKSIWENSLNDELYNNPSAVNKLWEDVLDQSAYGKEFKGTHYLNLTDAEKVDVLSTYRGIADVYGEEAAAISLENILRNIISARTTSTDASLNLGINIGCQTLGVIGESIAGANSLAIMGTDEENQQLYREGLKRDKDGKLKEIWAWRNPVYWGSVSQYGTMSPSKIRQYKYGVGSDEYNKEFAKYIQQVKAINPDVEIDAKALEEDFRAQWINEQWEEGRFKGDQISKNVTVRKAEDEDKLFGSQSMAEGLGMAGQMMGQIAMQAPRFGTAFLMGKWMRNTGKVGRATLNIANKTASGIGLIAPTIAISEAYAQGNYEQTILKNRETLDTYYQSASFQDKVNQHTSTPEFQQEVNDAYNNNSSYYLELAREIAPKGTEGSDLVAYARKVAEADMTQGYIKELQADDNTHLNDGALDAYWTSFAIEALRYGHFFTTYRQFIFGDAVKNLGLGKKTWSVGKQGATNNLTTKAIAKNWAKEALYSGWTNYLDETTSAFATGIGTQQFNDYLGMYYKWDEEYNNTLGNLMAGLHSTADSFTTPSSIRAGVIGSMGFLTGGNYANAVTAWVAPARRSLTPKEIASRMEKGMTYEEASTLSSTEAREELAKKLGFKGGTREYSGRRIALEWAAYLTGLSSLQNLSQQLSDRDYNKAICRDLNERISKDEKLLNDEKTARALFNVNLARQDANESQDELRIKDAAYKQAFEVYKVLHGMRQAGLEETETFQNFMDKIAAYQNGEVTAQDIDQFINNPNNKQDRAQYSDEENAAYATERIQKNASKFMELVESWDKNSAELANVFGSDISQLDKGTQDIYYDTLFKMCQQDDKKSRLSGIEESISGSAEVNAQTNSTVQYAMAQGGTKGKILDSVLGALDEHIKDTDKRLKKAQKAKEADKVEMLRLSNLKERLEETRHRLVTDRQALKGLAIDTRVLSKDEILKLSPEERLFTLTSPEAFTEEQQKTIEEARTDLLRMFGDDYLTKLKDAHTLNEQIKISGRQIDNILNGGILEAIINDRYYQFQNNISQVQMAAQEALRSLLPLLSNDGISAELLSSAAGMPASSIAQFAERMKHVNVQQAQALEQLATAIAGISIFDAAIENAGLDDASKKEVSIILANILRNSSDLTDLPKLFSDYVNNPAVPKEGKDLIIKVLNKQVELVKQREATNKGEQPSAPEEGDKKDAAKQSAVEEAELKKADLTTGEFKSLTPDQLAAANPQTFSPAKVPVQPQSDDVLPPNTQGTSMQGNWINAYDVKTLKETGKQVAKRGKTDGDIFNRWLQWTADNGIRYQDVVDFELAKILESNPNMPIHMITINAQENATQDNLIGDAVMLAVEATDAVKRVHNEEYGHYITSRGKEYLIIGRAGVERTATDEQQNTYNNMYNDLKSEATAYFNEHGEERFCVSDKYYTEVRYVNGGSITTSLLGEQATTHDIAEMLGDAKRDPFGIKKIDNLGWYVQVGDKACEPFGLPSKVVREGRYYTPNNPANNRGAVFAMVPAGNSKFMPVKVTAALLTNIKDGALKNQILNSLQKVVSPTYNTRQEGIMELLKTLVLNDTTNVLIGTQDFNTVTIVNDSQKVSYDLATTPAEEIIAAIMQIPFRINVNQSVFLDATKLKQYAEAGVFRTDAAVLGATGNNYSVYTCNTDGTLAKENAPVGNTDYTPSTTEVPSVVFNGNIARYRNGQWVIEDIVNGTRTVTSPAEIQQLNYSWQIIQQGLAPVETDAKTGFNYYIIDSNPNHPIAVKKDNAGKVIVASEEAARKLLEQAERKAKDKVAAAVLQAENDAAAKRGQVINLEEDEVTTPPVEMDNEAAAQRGQLLDLLEDEIESDITSKVAPTKENSDDNVTKTLLNLDMSEKSSTFAELFNSADHFEDIYNALVEKFGEENLPSDVSQYENFLKEHNIPTVVSSVEALIDMIKNCR